MLRKLLNVVELRAFMKTSEISSVVGTMMISIFSLKMLSFESDIEYLRVLLMNFELHYKRWQ